MQKSSENKQNASIQQAPKNPARKLELATPPQQFAAPSQLLELQRTFGNRHGQRQFFTPLGAGDGYSGLLERGRHQTELMPVPQ